jgi:hypothetical protein
MFDNAKSAMVKGRGKRQVTNGQTRDKIERQETRQKGQDKQDTNTRMRQDKRQTKRYKKRG